MFRLTVTGSRRSAIVCVRAYNALSVGGYIAALLGGTVAAGGGLQLARHARWPMPQLDRVLMYVGFGSLLVIIGARELLRLLVNRVEFHVDQRVVVRERPVMVSGDRVFELTEGRVFDSHPDPRSPLSSRIVLRNATERWKNSRRGSFRWLTRGRLLRA